MRCVSGDGSKKKKMTWKEGVYMSGSGGGQLGPGFKKLHQQPHDAYLLSDWS